MVDNTIQKIKHMEDFECMLKNLRPVKLLLEELETNSAE